MAKEEKYDYLVSIHNKQTKRIEVLCITGGNSELGTFFTNLDDEKYIVESISVIPGGLTNEYLPYTKKDKNLEIGQ